MDKDDDVEVFYIRNLGYEVEIWRNNERVSIGRGETQMAALADAICKLKEK